MANLIELEERLGQEVQPVIGEEVRSEMARAEITEKKKDAAAEPGFLVRSTDWYFRPKSFERSGSIYEAWGARKFKKLAIKFGTLLARKKKEDICYPNGYFLWDTSIEGLRQYEKETRVNEKIHIHTGAITAIITAAMTATVYFTGSPKTALLLGSYGALFTGLNGYCIMAQRYNRARLHHAIEKKENRRKRPWISYINPS